MSADGASLARCALADLILGDAAVLERAHERLSSAATGWDEAIALAGAWGVAAPLRARLDDLGVPLRGEQRARLRGACVARALVSLRVVEESAAVFDLLAAAGIDAIAIKGVGLIAALGLDPAHRVTGDLDLVVTEEDAERARRLLQAHGFSERNPEFASHMAAIAESRELHNFARALRRGNLEVDLHWRFGPRPPFALDARRLIARATPCVAAGRKLHVADPVDAVLIATHHALRGSFAPETTVRDVWDLRTWWDAGTLAERLDELVALAQRSGLGPSLHALWNAIVSRDPAHGIRSGYERLDAALAPSERAEAALLARYLEQQLVRGKTARFTREVFAPRLYVRSLAGALRRALAPPRSGDPRDAGAPPEHQRGPLVLRLRRFPARVSRIVRELARTEALPAYRAVARAQSRFH